VITSRERLERLLGGAALAGLRARLRRRYERGFSSDRFVLDRLSLVERTALESLLGRRARSAGSMALSMPEIDTALSRAGLADSLRHALESLDGPIRELSAERAENATQWEQVFATPLDGRLASLLAGAAGRGLVKRLAHGEPHQGESLLAGAHRVLELLPADGIALAHLAAKVLGDSHALDSGQPLATVVIAALRRSIDEPIRETWARSGVVMGELGAPVLTFNLAAAPGSVIGRMLCEAQEGGHPLHLNLRMLAETSSRWSVPRGDVFVCENPSVVAVAADRLGRKCAPLMCTSGMPAAAQQALLGQLSATGARLLYHGDFDWPGIAIGNHVMRSFRAHPWRFRSEDYRPEIGFALSGPPVAAEWDPSLAPKMSQAGLGLHEEAVIEDLLADLSA
jgi:uncharacterized protein (TIGR02679 family)